MNPGVKLPDAPFAVVHRSDGSGTTYVFTDYLSKVSPEWKEKVGTGKSVSWPVGLGGKGNEGVTGLVKQTPGSIGYVELAYANQNKLPTALAPEQGRELRGPVHRRHLGRRRRRRHPRRLQGLGDQRLRQGRLAHRLLHLPARPQGREGQGQGRGAGEVPLVGDPRRPGHRRSARVRAAPRTGREDAREDHPGRSRSRASRSPLPASSDSGAPAALSTPARAGNPGDRAWGWGITIFGGSLLVVAGLILLELGRVAAPAWEHIGLGKFLLSTDWDPVQEKFGALPFIYGTLVTSGVALAHRAAGLGRPRPLPLRDGAARAPRAGRLFHRDPGGHPERHLRPLGALRPGPLAARPTSSRSSSGRWASCPSSRGRPSGSATWRPASSWPS